MEKGNNMNLKKRNRDNRSLLAVVGMLMILISLLSFSQIQHNVVLLGNELVKNNDMSISIDSPVLVEKSLNGVKPSIIQKTIHLPIDINGNIELDEFPDKIGSGTIEDPYIIENYRIDGDYDNIPIKIQHTAKYLIIRNCEITHGNVDFGGIYICSSAHIFIVNNTVENCLNSGLEITKEWFSNISSEDIHIKDNIIRNNADNGISILSSINIEISNNQISFNEDDGIHIDNTSGDNRIVNNQIKFNEKNGIGCYDANISIFLNNISYNEWGITILRSYSKIFLNNITLNGWDGLRISNSVYIITFSSDYSVIHDNLILGNGGDGITLSSNYCSIYSNMIHYNKRNGIKIDGSYNNIYSNDFIGNSSSNYMLIYGVDVSNSKSLRNNISDNSICGFDEMVNDEGTETHIEGNFCIEDQKGIPGFSNEILFSCLGIGIFWLFKRKRNRIAWTESF